METLMLERSLIRQIRRYKLIPFIRRGTHYGRALSKDIGYLQDYLHYYE